MSQPQQPLLKLEGVKKYYPIKGGILQRVQGYVKAVENVSLEVFEGESMALSANRDAASRHLGERF